MKLKSYRTDYRFKEILKEGQVYNLLEGGPRKALEDHCITTDTAPNKDGRENFRMVVCGGDGSIGWALSVMDLMNIPLGKNQATNFYAK